MADENKLAVFCDESSQSKANFMILGGIILPLQNVQKLNSLIEEHKQCLNLISELKWTKITNQKQNEYDEIIEIIFQLIATKEIQFSCMIVDNTKIDHRKFNEGNHDIGFFKFYHQFLLHGIGKPLAQDSLLHIFLDQKSTKQSLDSMKDLLNHELNSNRLKQLEFRNSRLTPIIQFTDILIGGLAHRKNELHLQPNCRSSKVDISKKIIELANIDQRILNTPKNRHDFKIWNFDMRQK